jgi:4-carboxymuconolactone decarboxylase
MRSNNEEDGMTEQEAHATLKEKGRQVLGEILGESYLAKRDATNNDFWGPTRQLSEELAYASLWTRDGLDRKQRSMITVAMLCALNRPHELRIHLLGALNNGCTKVELREIFTHAIAYCGFPAALDALRVAEEVLKEQGKF